MSWILTHKKRRRYDKLEQYDLATGLSTGTVKENLPADVDYISSEISILCGPVTISREEGRETDMTLLDTIVGSDRTGIATSGSPVAEITVELIYFPILAGPQVLLAPIAVTIDDVGDPDVQTQLAAPMPVSVSQLDNKFYYKVANTSLTTGAGTAKILKVQLTCTDTNTGNVYWEETFIIYSNTEYPSDNSDLDHPTFALIEPSCALLPSSDFYFKTIIREVINP